MPERLRDTSPTRGKLRDTSTTRPHLDANVVAEGLGAVPAGKGVGADPSPEALYLAFLELTKAPTAQIGGSVEAGRLPEPVAVPHANLGSKSASVRPKVHRPIRLAPPTQPLLSPEEVGRALGAEPTGRKVEPGADPVALYGAMVELMKRPPADAEQAEQQATVPPSTRPSAE